MQKITILTRRVSIYAFIRKGVRNILRFLKYFILGGRIDTDILFLSGHIAVTKSLLAGLKETKADFIFNPISEKDVSDTVVVLSDMSALAQAITWKKEGKIKRLLAGPNLLDLPTERNKALTAPEIDLIIVPSDMVKQIYEKLNPSLVGKIAIWYAGVDTNYWKPIQKEKEKEILVYWKNTTPKAFCLEVEAIIKKNGYSVNRVRYGHYNKQYYKNMLNRSAYAVVLSVTETQSLALVEAWAMNVPTIVWYPEIEHSFIRGVITTAAPYLSEDTGVKWKELNDLDSLLADNTLSSKTFSPRDWVLNNMTDRISAELLIKICGSITR